MLRVNNLINKVSEEELEQDSREVFKEDKETVEKDIVELREWILGTPHLQNVRHDDSFLKLFLRGTNYNVNQAKDKGWIPIIHL